MKWTPRQTRFAWRPVKCNVCKDKVWLEPYYRCGPGQVPDKNWRHCRPCYAAALLRGEEAGTDSIADLLKRHYAQGIIGQMQQKVPSISAALYPSTPGKLISYAPET